jgi:uncharacterized protein (TIGR01615 family)
MTPPDTADAFDALMFEAETEAPQRLDAAAQVREHGARLLHVVWRLAAPRGGTEVALTLAALRALKAEPANAARALVSVVQTHGWAARNVTRKDYSFVLAERDGERLVLDWSLRELFDIARPSVAYTAALGSVPAMFVGTPDRLRQLVIALCDAAASSFAAAGLSVPPWRRLEVVLTRWETAC